MEDNAADVFLIRAAIQNANVDADIHVVRDGEQAVEFFERADADGAAPCPALVLLDINLPRKQGDEVLKQMRGTNRCRCSRVIAVSTSDSPFDRENMLRLGADRYFRKPSEYRDFMKLGGIIQELLSQA